MTPAARLAWRAVWLGAGLVGALELYAAYHDLLWGIWYAALLSR